MRSSRTGSNKTNEEGENGNEEGAVSACYGEGCPENAVSRPVNPCPNVDIGIHWVGGKIDGVHAEDIQGDGRQRK